MVIAVTVCLLLVATFFFCASPFVAKLYLNRRVGLLRARNLLLLDEDELRSIFDERWSIVKINFGHGEELWVFKDEPHIDFQNSMVAGGKMVAPNMIKLAEEISRQRGIEVRKIYFRK